MPCPCRARPKASANLSSPSVRGGRMSFAKVASRSNNSVDAQTRVPVIIVGGGPVGMVLALQLDQWGVPCTIINKEGDSRWHPKGNTHNSRTMEHYRRLGLAKQIRTFGLPVDHPTDVGYFTTLAGFEVARLRLPSEAEKRQASGQAHPRGHMTT